MVAVDGFTPGGVRFGGRFEPGVFPVTLGGGVFMLNVDFEGGLGGGVLGGPRMVVFVDDGISVVVTVSFFQTHIG